MLRTTDLALMIMGSWQASSRLSRHASRQTSEIAQMCADELGEEMPDNAMTHSMVSAWLKKQDGVWLNGSDWKMPEQQGYLGFPE